MRTKYGTRFWEGKVVWTIIFNPQAINTKAIKITTDPSLNLNPGCLTKYVDFNG
jgi:hypothetical protein